MVAELVPDRHLVLRSREHLPPGWTDRYGATIDFTWVFVLRSLGDGRTRFLFRTRATATPWWVDALYALAVVPADFVMSRQMLRGIRTRAERAVS